MCGPDVPPPTASMQRSGTSETTDAINNPPEQEQYSNEEPDSSVGLPEYEPATDDDNQDEASKRLPKALRDITDFNKKGRKEEDCSVSSRLRTRR